MDFELASGEDYNSDFDLVSGDEYVYQYEENDILSDTESDTDPDVEIDLVESSPGPDSFSAYETYLIDSYSTDLNQNTDPVQVELTADPSEDAPLELISGDQDLLTEGAVDSNPEKEIVVVEDPESVQHLNEIKALLKSNLESKIPESSDYTLSDIYLSIEDLKKQQEEQTKTIKIIGKNQILYQDITLGFTVAFFSAFILYLFIGRIR